MKALTRKLCEMEKNVLNSCPDPEETFLGFTNVNEQELFQTACKIIKTHTLQTSQLEAKQKANPHINYAFEREQLVLSGEAQTLVDQALRIIFLRSTNIFDTYLAPFFHLEDSVCKMLFYSRFFWFLSEMKDMLRYNYLVRTIVCEPGFFDLNPEEQEEKLKPVHATCREWFTDESHTKYLQTNS
ncbi:MAG: hypothetical protein FWD52_08165 [Candidatus Bathyarchaeota archaeon]|nr:hypothetical protein [Candidatus Termiticorpusculum sp.]